MGMSNQRIIKLLDDLHAFNKLDKITVSIVSDAFQVDAENLCSDNGITYWIENKNSIKCYKCKVVMVKGIALENTLVAGMPDFPDQADDIAAGKIPIGQTVHYGGTGKLINVYKCPECGHSVSIGC